MPGSGWLARRRRRSTSLRPSGMRPSILDLLGNLGARPDEIFEGSARLGSQLGNIRSALEWSFGPQGDPGLALPLAAASAALFLHFSLLVECRTGVRVPIELLELGYLGTPTELELQAALGFVLMFTRGNSARPRKLCSGRWKSPWRWTTTGPNCGCWVDCRSSTSASATSPPRWHGRNGD